MKCQEQETALHQAFLDKIAEEIADLQRKHTETLAKISEYRLRYSELQHRILKVMIIQEISRKMGLSLLPEEEKLKSRLESVSATVNSAPFKVIKTFRVNVLICSGCRKLFLFAFQVFNFPKYFLRISSSEFSVSRNLAGIFFLGEN